MRTPHYTHAQEHMHLWTCLLCVPIKLFILVSKASIIWSLPTFQTQYCSTLPVSACSEPLKGRVYPCLWTYLLSLVTVFLTPYHVEISFGVTSWNSLSWTHKLRQSFSWLYLSLLLPYSFWKCFAYMIASCLNSACLELELHDSRHLFACI